MRLYLDTNIIVFLLFDQDELDGGVMEALFDYENTLQTSSICVHELIHLCQTGKVGGSSKKERIDPSSIIRNIHEVGIGIVPVNERHLSAYSNLPIHGDHRDPNDRLIIAQAISDKAILVSSDHKFDKYERDGLQFMFNER